MAEPEPDRLVVAVTFQRAAVVVVRLTAAVMVVLVLLVVMHRSTWRDVVAHSQSLLSRDVQRPLLGTAMGDISAFA